MSSVRAAIFDLDGTLVDAFADITAAVNMPLVKRGVMPHPVESIRQWVGDGAGMLVERATPSHLMNEIETIHEEMLVYYTAHSSDLAELYPGILEVLKGLHADGVKIGVLTNKPHPVALDSCEKMGLTPYLHDVRGQCDVESPRKPDPAALHE